MGRPADPGPRAEQAARDRGRHGRGREVDPVGVGREGGVDAVVHEQHGLVVVGERAQQAGRGQQRPARRAAVAQLDRVDARRERGFDGGAAAGHVGDVDDEQEPRRPRHSISPPSGLEAVA